MSVATAVTMNTQARAIVASTVSAGGNTSLSPTGEAPTIEWFKKELRISPKYAEEPQGILGLSWAHFMTMVFLVIFFVLGLAALLIRYRRTKELLTLLIEGKDNESTS
jgi:hypothetical protein